MWQQLELASELESDLKVTADWGKKWLVDFDAAKTQLVLFNRSNNNGTIDVKMDGSVFEEKSSFKMLGGLSVLNWIEVVILSKRWSLSQTCLNDQRFKETTRP